MDRGIMAWFGNIELWFEGGVSGDAYTDEGGRTIDFRKI